MRQAFGTVQSDGTLISSGSDNFTVRKDENKTGVYYIDSDVFYGQMPSFVATPWSAHATACVLYTRHWHTGTIEVRTGFSDKNSEYTDCAFSFIAMNT